MSNRKPLPMPLWIIATWVAALAAAPYVAIAAPDSPQPVIPESAGPKTCVPYLGNPFLGYGQFPLGLVAPDGGNQGYSDLAIADNQETLPEAVWLRDNTQGFNGKIEVALRDGYLYARNTGEQDWRVVPTPDCLAGEIASISINEDALVALDADGWMYTLSNLLSSPSRWGWIHAWGGPVWLGPGLQTTTTASGRWALSLIGNHTDRYYDTPDGKQQPVSLAKVTQVVSLSEDGAHIYSFDPWLATDYSYEIATPLNGRFIVNSISASGSQMFVMNRYGDMYTRLADFDINGSDPAQFRYTWGPDDRDPASNAVLQLIDPFTAPISLPLADWRQQPKIPGRITDRLSIHSTGVGSNNRELRVEGWDQAGNTGFWFKPMLGDQWYFRRTDEPITGIEIENSADDRSADTLAPPSPYHYRGDLGYGATMAVNEFAWAAPRHNVTITINGNDYPFVLHTIDGRWRTLLSMRQLPFESPFGQRPAGLVEAVPRNFYGTLEVPDDLLEQSRTDAALANFINNYVGDTKYRELYLSVTPSTMRIIHSPFPGLSILTDQNVAVLSEF